MIEVGTKIIGNFGAMIPLFFGEVVGVRANDEVVVECESGDVITIMKDEIDAAVGKLSPKAAALLPIGYYTEKAYYET